MISEQIVFFRMKNTINVFSHGSEIVKTELYETWFCRLVQGRARILFNLEEHDIEAITVFSALEGDDLKVVSSSDDMRMEVLVFDNALMNSIYPAIGSEIDACIDKLAFATNRNMEPSLARGLEMDYDLLLGMLQQPVKIGQHKMLVSLITHYMLIYCNAANNTTATMNIRNDTSSRIILNRFFNLLPDNIRQGNRSTGFFADQLYVSVRHLFKVCKTETGQTPKEIIHETLMGEIKNMLLTSDRTLQQITDLFGFPDQSAFGQYFKRQTGISPSEFRKKYK